jgi:hypothetical protein
MRITQNPGDGKFTPPLTKNANGKIRTGRKARGETPC